MLHMGTADICWENDDQICVIIQLDDGRTITLITNKDREHHYRGDVLWNSWPKVQPEPKGNRR